MHNAPNAALTDCPSWLLIGQLCIWMIMLFLLFCTFPQNSISANHNSTPMILQISLFSTNICGSVDLFLSQTSTICWQIWIFSSFISLIIPPPCHKLSMFTVFFTVEVHLSCSFLLHVSLIWLDKYQHYLS